MFPEEDGPLKTEKRRKTKSADVVFLRKPDEQMTAEVPQHALESIRSLLSCLEEKDVYTYGHSIRVAEYSVLLAEEMGLPADQISAIELSAILHDIGKIGVPDEVLLKPARLTKAEFEIMKSHPVRSAKVLTNIASLKPMLDGIKYHHERYDGLGYPEGLKNEAIPLFARIILIADTYDAMTSTRPYRLALDKEVAFEELLRCSGTQFDPTLVEHFIRAVKTRDAKRKPKDRVSWLRKIA
jgi:putative nucleotidyltransferase with HDIG domain